MSIDISGRNAKVESSFVKILVSATHPLIILAALLPWAKMLDLVVEDLKVTTKKGRWWLGRRIYVRIHLGVYLLQKLYDLTDRAAEYGVKDNAAYQLFCGRTIVSSWHEPDHTKIEEFRSRLSPETQRNLANILCQHAVGLGFGDASQTDFDSTVQEANITYPTDASLMVKMSGLAKKVLDYLCKKTRGLVPETLKIDIKAIKSKARSYFFAPKSKDPAARRDAFQALHQTVKDQLRDVVKMCEGIDSSRISRMPWNIKRALDQITTYAWRHLLDVGHFIRKGNMKAGKVMSFHAQALACIKKGKVHKDKDFGRIYQLGRIGGNLLFILECGSIKMNDKTSFLPLLAEHAKLFGENTLKSVGADKGYWSNKNRKELVRRGVKEDGLQRPANLKRQSTAPKELQAKLRDRRAGIEPLIGHTKHGGQLGKSRMKSDAATLAAGYSSVLSFNMRQLIRHQTGKMKKAM